MKKVLLIFFVFSQFISFGYELEQDSVKNYKLSEIIIQSPKYNRSIFKIPAAASMVSERLIENNHIETLTDVSTLVPNFFMPDYGSKLTTPVYIRGVGNRINTPSVGLYVDGIPYFEKSVFNFDFYDIERIEVLRGPQGTLYGRNTMGGLINVITNRPSKTMSTKLSFDYGNYNQLNTNITHNQPIGKSLSLQTSINKRHNDGFFTNEFLADDVDKIDSYSGRIKALFAPSEKFEALLTLQYEDSHQVGYPYALFNNETNTAADISYNDKSVYNRKLFSEGLTLNYSTPVFLVRANFSYQVLDDHQQVDQDFTPSDLFFVTQDQKLNIFSQELNIESSEEGFYNWLFGVFSFKQLLNKSVSVNYGADAIKRYKLPYSSYEIIKNYDNTNSGIALFHQSTFNFNKLSITAGLRVDYEKATLDYVYNREKNTKKEFSEDVVSDLDFFEFLPKLAVNYSISKYIVPYITIAKGYNSGGFNSTFEREEDRSFRPERSWNYEAGIKAKWLEQRVYGNLSFFYIDWENQQVYQPVPSTKGSMLTNAGKSESRGIEFEVKVLPLQDLELWAALGYNEAKFIDYIKDDDTDYSGNYLPYVPRFSFNIGSNYTIDINRSWLDNINFHVTYNGYGKHYWHESNVAYQDYYGLLNSRISFIRNNVSLSFWGKNILKREYNSFYFNALGNSYSQAGKPATMGVNLKVSF